MKPSSNHCIFKCREQYKLKVMNDCKASKQNFDSSYIYKVEEREEIEKIVCHSDIRGLVSIETNELPKVTRYFLKNNEGVYECPHFMNVRTKNLFLFLCIATSGIH